jgi:type III restriction enzyme
MPFTVETTEPEGARLLLSNDGGALGKSLFSPIYESELNKDEQDVAVYLDADSAISWWHRNVARVQYGLQGWKRSRIYPDFIFAAGGVGTSRRITVLETKGDHLDNLDTEYKRALLSFLSGTFQWDDVMPAGELQLVTNTGESVECTLILMNEWKTKLPEYLTDETPT